MHQGSQALMDKQEAPLGHRPHHSSLLCQPHTMHSPALSPRGPSVNSSGSAALREPSGPSLNLLWGAVTSTGLLQGPACVLSNSQGPLDALWGFSPAGHWPLAGGLHWTVCRAARMYAGQAERGGLSQVLICWHKAPDQHLTNSLEEEKAVSAQGFRELSPCLVGCKAETVWQEAQ